MLESWLMVCLYILCMENITIGVNKNVLYSCITEFYKCSKKDKERLNVDINTNTVSLHFLFMNFICLLHGQGYCYSE